jgi:hypothetical protein
VTATVAVLAAGAALMLGQVSAAAATYSSGTVGYDISYPQCGATYPSGAFGIVGVNAGYPFTYCNTCFTSEWAYAAPNRSLYINTGYDPSYTTVDSRHSTQDCVNSSTAVNAPSAQQRAWAVGCSEAERSVAYASCQDATLQSPCASTVVPAAWWLDIETGNSWCGQPYTSCSDLSLNQYTIQGILDTVHRLSNAPVGVYSTSSQWNAIVGSTTMLFSGIAADWLATGFHTAKRAKQDCASAGFTGSAPIWLVQYVPGSYDADYAC